MSDQYDPTVEYMQYVVAWQPRLYAFALSLTGNPNEADDVLQNTNLVLLRKRDSFRPGSDFGAWALQIARYEVQQHRDASHRARRRFDDVLVDQLAAKTFGADAEPGDDLRLLRKCVSRLSPSEREMLGLRYGGDSVQAIAEKQDRSTASISQTLYRIRGKLAECIKRALNAERRDEP